MDISIFTDKTKIPTFDELISPLGTTYDLWMKIREVTLNLYPNGKEEWNYPGKKYGWSFRIKDKKRAILYFLPREGYFKVGFVYGQKGVDQVIASSVNESIKTDLLNAKKYAEGRGVIIEIRNESLLNDIKTLIEIKLAN